jgi:2-polyprenyl-3-methyl-5-hydroxy-6-metoxy-1,4-benzoquinol methylase
MQKQITPQSTPRQSAWYTGDAGVAYFQWQNDNAEFVGQIEARKFQKYVKPDDAVMDFGCGGGHTLRHLKCMRRVGIDVNPAALAVATQAGIECYDSISQAQDQAFNVIISNHALEHVEHPIAILRALRSKLVPSGILVLCLPMDDWRTQRVYNPEDLNHHLHTWTPQLLGNSLLEAGFRSDQFSIRILPHALFPGTTATYGKIPGPLFDKLCQVFAAWSKRRQLLAVAAK